ncbi:NAD(P)/FAD-dependent oxidoreductase [Sulfitobacter donghicola]|uniref:FAD-binding oxidoreductase n=1 Tax=Sulfitobacter donghicola DSW-25 = KCTC 12864 = JCM 14565 TaxID=1300350 RepID=A0A073IG64_9RHOB|nr:FAD-dependent oxidoreductase [Sulfitobacter donghicola]KEJ89333.1 FAD-binding oxidoreductase [Sulfitobacter donghicola DSW-25 = KCTC 12864 = JCM 14565]KIN69139.1 Oxidoreductase, FAD-binding [Sulfitobacter donghicola DSW-25 = KCTC 12864 = JCM 14565]
MQILVAGAGIVGISTAIWLQRAGHDVTVVDREGPASGTSHGNAGVLAAGAVVPVTTPGLMGKAPNMLFDPNGPLFLRWSYLPRLIPFLTRYLSYATDAHVDHYATAMSSLLHDSVEQHQALAADTPAARFISTEDYCFGYTTRADFEADSYGWSKRDAQGVKYEVVSGAEYAQYDPVFGNTFETVVRCKNHGRISDPGAYVKALAAHFVEQGGTLQITNINDIETKDGAIAALLTDDGRLSADKIVFAMGPWSREIAHKLGVKVPFESERGYHIELMNPSAMPRSAMMVASGKFVLTPMEGRLRAAGIIEFGGLDAPASRGPLDMLRRQVKKLLPDLEYDEIVEWMGHRPAPADSLPVIGANDTGNLSFSAFGHQHVGLTGGPKTGRVIAELISERTPNLDLRPFDPSKFKDQ